MKINGYEKQKGDYYIGIDSGTSSAGWAATDLQYNLLRFKGNSMWGVRLFEEAQSAEERRTARTSRRVNQRRRQRIEFLNLIFDEEISKIDPSFFIRLKESSLFAEDKSSGAEYPLFNDAHFTDKDYYKLYPTTYHLRKELISSSKPHDIRMIYLALHHILKNRGHFLFDMDASKDYKTADLLLDDLERLLLDEYDVHLEISDRSVFIENLKKSDISVTAKKKLLRESINNDGESEAINLFFIADMLAGATVKFSDLFCDETLKNADKKSLTLNSDFESDLGAIEEVIGSERLEVIFALKELYDSAKLAQMLKDYQYISEAKVAQFETNKADLAKLKKYVKENAPEKYKEIFSIKKDKLNNYAAYSRKTLSSGDYSCKKQEDFCAYLISMLPGMKTAEAYADIYNKINNKTFLPRLRGSDNSVIPYQLHRKELVKILENASDYLPFLNETDGEGLTIRDKIVSIFDFKIPYYVGPLNKNSNNSWVVRTDEKIYPWNFEKVVDIEKSSEQFITNLISRCTYTGEDVLPKESLLFSKYNVLNEINPLSVNGNPIPVSVKQEIFNELFVASSSKVTKKAIKEFLIRKGYALRDDEVAGIDDIVKSKLRSYHDFNRIMNVDANYEAVEDIIRAVTIFGEDKRLLSGWLRKKHPDLDKEQVAAICRLKYKDWGSLSKTFLQEIYSPDENGEAHSIIDLLYNTNCNLMKLLSGNYRFRENADAYRCEKYGVKNIVKEIVDDMYVSPAVKRSLLQTLKIVDEIVDIRKAAPKKIFIEVAREKNDDQNKKRTLTRKEKLTELYKACRKEYSELAASLESKDESELRQDALYLYYTQFGKCMYSGEPIDIEKLKVDYDIDHIFPQSRIKDDSIDNRVLVKRKYNEDKGNKYPINADWRRKMQPFWYQLKEKDMISAKKYERLVRCTELSKDELSSFVARQLVETRQSTKALAQILGTLYRGAGTRIVYSKAGNITQFRDDYKFIKCRDVNDLHHAKDAYLNIVVGNVYDTKFTDQFFKNIKNETYSLNRVFDYPVAGAWEVDKSFETVSLTMRKNNIIVTRKPYAQKGALFDLQPVPRNCAKLPLKQESAVSDYTKYGGYTGRYAAHFIVVEHTKKNKIIRTIEPVYIYKNDLFDVNPEMYCELILSLNNPRIICDKILISSMIEINGERLILTGGSDSQGDGRDIYNSTYQLIVDNDSEKYIKNLLKFIERYEKERGNYCISSFDKVNCDDNIRLFGVLLSKLDTKIYGKLFASEKAQIENNKDRFNELSVYEQCVVLKEFLKLFRCNAEVPNFTLLCDKKVGGRIRKNCDITKNDTVYLINQSITGLFETRVDLLK